MAWAVSRQTRRILLELAIGDLVQLVRPTVDRNRRGDGTPSPAFEALALALDRFDRAGGLETLTIELSYATPEPGTPARSGAHRSASAKPLREWRMRGPSAAARSGALRTAAHTVGAAEP
jgi:hypothetical protein